MALNKTERRTLHKLRKLLTMTSFGASDIGRNIVIMDGKDRVSMTTFIVEETRVWRESWILPTLDALLSGDAKLAERIVHRR